MNTQSSKAGVVIVGASVAGCAAAIAFAKKGVPVTLIEKRSNADFHKPICTHFIQPCSVEAWKKLDMYDALMTAGGVKNTIAISTRWGWIPNAPIDEEHAINMRRLTLDPMIRQKAISTPGVTLVGGSRVVALTVDESQRVVGVSAEKVSGGGRVDYPCSLVIAADGRESEIAELAQVKTREWVNNRFSCFAFFRGIPNESRTVSRMWMLDPYIAYQFPNDGDTTLIALMPTKDRVDDFKDDRDRSFREIVRNLPDAPDIENAERLGEYRINTKNSMLLREKPPAGLALVGDAFITTDPLHGFGISWGILSSIQLAEYAADAVLGGRKESIDRSVERYHRDRQREVWGHFKIMADMARAEPMPKPQQILFSAATRDDTMATIVQRFLAGLTGTSELLSPFTMVRAISANVRHAVRKRLKRESTPRTGKLQDTLLSSEET
ncbi:NAD(P)/FAD-dependent oxidoreductase [Tahibacter amnicola]|uniref:Protein CbrA n=1 Tax=Tahibacter amnicola TaxID=2976241 RepID=A0ABY6BLN3_9GAMM|nr:FAD-dependent monooxygenase [Tahibacter amnicola]UXI69476.1 FAD-dependent monooxygenase [Tahibacter amnicola]